MRNGVRTVYSARTWIVLAMTMILLVSTAVGAAAQEVNLRFTWWEGQRADVMQRYIDMYQEQNPHVNITLEIVPFEQYWQTLPVHIAGGRAPDIMFMISGNVQRYASMGALLDLGAYMTADEIAQLYDPHVAMISYGDEIAALPFTLTTLSLFYNKEHAAAAGIEPPQTLDEAWTWEEFETAAERMKTVAGTPYGVNLGTRDFWLLPYIFQNGGTVLNAEMNGSGINTPEAAEALEFLRRLVTSGIASTPADPMAGDLFTSGLMPLNVGGHWDMARYERAINDFDYGMTFVPRQKQHAVGLGGDFIAVYSQTNHPQEAADFVRWLTSGEANIQYNAENYYLPPRRDAEIEYSARQREMELAMQQASIASEELTMQRAIPEWGEFLQVLETEMQLAMMGEKSVADALTTIERRINSSFR